MFLTENELRDRHCPKINKRCIASDCAAFRESHAINNETKDRVPLHKKNNNDYVITFCYCAEYGKPSEVEYGVPPLPIQPAPS